MHRFLVFYYDDNNYRAATVSAVDRDSIPPYIEAVAYAKGWEVMMTLELHPGYFDDDGPMPLTELVIENVPYNIRSLTEFGLAE